MLSEIKKFNRPLNFKNKGKLRYSSKSYSNPFFTKKRKKNIHKKTKLSFKTRVILFILIFVVLFSLWFLFYSNFFIIKNIEIKGRGMISEKDIQKYTQEQINKKSWILIQKNIFFFDKKNLRKKLEEKYSFNELSINKKIPRTIKINYSEKKYKMIWKKGETYAYADESGNVINSLNILDAKLKDYPIVENIDGQKDIKKRLDFIFLAFTELKKYEDLKIEKFIIDKDINTIKAVLVIGPQIYFNIDRNINHQIKKLLIIKKEKLKEKFKEKIYIDLRLGDSVYFY